MGIIALGVGLGGAGAFGAMLHAVNHSLAKAMLFLLSGNILARYQTKNIAQVRGLVERRAGDRGALDCGVSGHHRHAAVRAVPEQVHDFEGRD